MAEHLLQRWGTHSAFYAFEPVNEPVKSDATLPILKDFYKQVRKLVQRYAPQAIFVFFDSWDYNPNTWNDLFPKGDNEKVAMDHHYYHAFSEEAQNTTQWYCNAYENEAKNALNFNFPVWFGEWSLATDACAHWLGGFNDGNVNLT